MWVRYTRILEKEVESLKRNFRKKVPQKVIVTFPKII